MSHYKEALDKYKASLEIKGKVLGGSHPSFAETLNNIGLLYHKKGEYDKALENYDECLRIKRESLGEAHPSYASTLNNIGVTYH